MHEVVITGIGMVTPLGGDLESFSDAVMDGASGIRSLETRFAGTLAAGLVTEDIDGAFDRGELSLMDRASRLAVVAAGRALEDAGSSSAMRRDMALFVGNGCGPAQFLSDSYEAFFTSGKCPPLTLLKCMQNAPANHVTRRHGLHGPSHVVSAACASATIAIGETLHKIRHGYLDAAVVGGTESPFGDGLLKCWDALRVLAAADGADPRRTCKPFARRRGGIVLGEGAVFFVMESAAHARSRGARIKACLLGFGSSSDAAHMTEPAVAGQVQAMRAALADAGVPPQRISYVNAHGTATRVGDAVEAVSMREVFNGDAVPWVSSTKAHHGHLLGASGAIELAACIAALDRDGVPPTLNLDDPDPECALRHAANEAVAHAGLDCVLSSSFAFGGMNACLVLRGGAVAH
ncbi:MAG: beta-ketoacyl-[acyl-carrier-protein] synthase family protein [Burkholderiaceae bacterium]